MSPAGNQASPLNNATTATMIGATANIDTTTTKSHIEPRDVPNSFFGEKFMLLFSRLVD
jgi:hypothetical protein